MQKKPHQISTYGPALQPGNFTFEIRILLLFFVSCVLIVTNYQKTIAKKA